MTDIRVFVMTNGGLSQVPSLTGTYTHTSLADAKQATAAYIGGPNKANFASGYDAIVVDLTERKLLSWAGQPKPSLTWSDTVTSPTT